MNLNTVRIVDIFLLVAFPLALFILFSSETKAQESNIIDDRQVQQALMDYQSSRFAGLFSPLVVELPVVNPVTLPQACILLFTKGQFTLNAQDRMTIQQHARFLNQNPDLLLMVNGHAMVSELGSRDLSRKRVNAVRKSLLDFGVSAQQIIVNVDANGNDGIHSVELEYARPMLLEI